MTLRIQPKRFAVGAVVAGFLAASASVSAHAQTADHPSCAPWKAQWATARSGEDLSVMDTVIGMIPGVCPVLKADAAKERAQAETALTEKRAAAAKEAAALQAARVAAAREADPCVQARNDWGYVQTASEDAVRAYRDSLPAACVVWRNEAQTRLAAMAAEKTAKAEEAERQRVAAAEEAERVRVAAEQRQAAALAAAQAEREEAAAEAARIGALILAAKATGIEGKWVSSKGDKKRCSAYDRYVVRADGWIDVQSVSSGGGLLGGLLSGLIGGQIESAAGKTVRWSGADRIVNGDEMQKADGSEKKYRCG